MSSRLPATDDHGDQDDNHDDDDDDDEEALKVLLCIQDESRSDDCDRCVENRTIEQCSDCMKEVVSCVVVVVDDDDDDDDDDEEEERFKALLCIQDESRSDDCDRCVEDRTIEQCSDCREKVVSCFDDEDDEDDEFSSRSFLRPISKKLVSPPK